MGRKTKFTEEQIEEMAKKYRQGASSVELARKYDGSVSTVLDRLKRFGCKIRQPGRKRVRFTNGEIEEMVAMYREGASSREIAEKFGVSKSVVLRSLKEAGCEIRSSGQQRITLSEEKMEKMAEKYQQGSSAAMLAEEFGISEPTVLKQLRDFGCEIRNPSRYVERDIPDPWDDVNTAYVFGVLIGDASLTGGKNNPNGVKLQTPDIEFSRIFTESVESAFGIKVNKHPEYETPEFSAFSVDLGRSYDRFRWRTETWRVPEPFFNAPGEIKVALCQGKLDSDGRTRNCGSVEVVSIREYGLKDMMRIMEGLGLKVKIYGPYPRKEPKQKDTFELRIPKCPTELVRLPRKKKVLRGLT